MTCLARPGLHASLCGVLSKTRETNLVSSLVAYDKDQTTKRFLRSLDRHYGVALRDGSFHFIRPVEGWHSNQRRLAIPAIRNPILVGTWRWDFPRRHTQPHWPQKHCAKSFVYHNICLEFPGPEKKLYRKPGETRPYVPRMSA